MSKNVNELLDHDADGIREYDNALPRWWLYGFYLTIVFAVAYMVNLYVLPEPLIGLKNQIAEYEAEEAAAKTLMSNRPKKDLSTVAVLTDASSLQRGKEIFEGADNLCSTCHRTDLGGQVGPNLTDDFWLHGCSLQDIMTSITTGYPEMGMLPYGSTNKLSDEDLQKVASYIISLHDSHPPDPKPVDAERDVECESDEDELAL